MMFIADKIKTFVTLLPIFLVACAATPDELQLLDKSFMLYEKALRWQEYDVVIGFHKNERDKLTPERRKALKRFRVTGYNVVYSRVMDENTRATQVVEVKYYNPDYNLVKELTLNNQWEYDSEKERWQLTNDLPAFE